MHYYIRINFLPAERNDAFLAGRCIKVLHGTIKRNSISDVAIAFPNWSDEAIGSSIAFVSCSPAQLEQVISQKYFQEMKQLEYFEITSIKESASDAAQVSYIRNQSIDKATAAGAKRRLRRLQKRAEQRGEYYTPKNQRSATQLYLPYHQVPLSSTENGNDFWLKIQRNQGNSRSDGSLNTYGLSFAGQAPFTVPIDLP